MLYLGLGIIQIKFIRIRDKVLDIFIRYSILREKPNYYPREIRFVDDAIAKRQREGYTDSTAQVSS